LGDEIGRLGDLGPSAIRVADVVEPAVLSRLIANAQAVVAHSFQCSVVALAHGVPVFRAATPDGTKNDALASFGGVRTIDPGGSLGEAIVRSARQPVSPDVVAQVSQLSEHWDRIAALADARDEAARRSRQLAARRIVAEMPALLSAAMAGAVADVRQASDADRRALEARQTATIASLARANDRALTLRDRIGALEVDVARERSQAAADRRRAEEELERRRRDLATLRNEARQLKRKADSFDRIRRRRVVRLGVATLRVGRRVMNATGLRPGAPAGARRTDRSATIEQERLVAERLREQAPGSARTSGPLVSLIVLNRNGVDHLRRLLPAIDRSTYRSFELIVVDNASTDDSVELLSGSTAPTVNLLRNTDNQAFSDANNQAAGHAHGELLLFLNNDVEPIAPGWLGHLVDTLEEQAADAVGARLVYPRRQLDDNAGDSRFPDLTLQHRGIALTAADGVPTGKNLGTGEDPFAPEASTTVEVPGVTAACMLVRREAFSAVGGFTEGYVYGTEDVDLCLKLRAAGGRIVYDGGAVLWHREYGTQNVHGREWKKQNRVRNRQRFVDRWSPQVFREVFRDRVLGEGRWSTDPLHVAITLTRDDANGATADDYTAHELGAALEELGWRISYIERRGERWYELDRSVDVVICLLDQFDVRRIRRGVVTVAWVRNWTDRWLGHPWFDEYDVVLASSQRSVDVIARQSTRAPLLMPLATNPDRFAAAAPSAELRADVLFAGNLRGKSRAIESVLPSIADGRSVAVYGEGWEGTALAPYHRGSLPYERVPEAYASAGVVLDDTADSSLPYGAVNARVFDALAAGALVVSDNDGARELLGKNMPIARSPQEFRAVVEWASSDPDAARRAQASLRDAVLDRHTYQHRAAELREHLLRWADAERFGILVGIPDWEQAPTWGDYHFARALQHQLEQRGNPTRVHLLDEWGRSQAARADVIVHVHGLSDHRPRPSQLNLLWLISHPDRVTPEMCNKYDAVLVASDSFAAELAPRVRVPVVPLHQATDPGRFYPEPTGPAHELLFVGNSRRSRRAILEDLKPVVHDLAVYGKGWTSDLIDPIHVHGEHIPNDQLHRFYSSAAIVLNDHWPDMRAHGFLSNRLYDVLASGGFVISDAAVGLEDEFDGAVVSYSDPEQLRRLIDQYLADEPLRRSLSARGREIVLARHTFAHRAERLIDLAGTLEPLRPRRIERWRDVNAWLTRTRRRTAGGALVMPPAAVQGSGSPAGTQPT
jgi:GT2 family glycosyltransferase/spore maturation protein CgeB